jgi:flagellar motor switch protein FliM
MTDPVLTDEEKGALLEGMSSGEVEVHSNRGQTYATVKPFEIGTRARISTNSYPRLQSMDRQFAGRMSKQAEALLNADAVVEFVGISNVTYGDVCESIEGLGLVVEFEPSPLQGPALIHFDSATVRQIVETFYGGHGNEAGNSHAEFFTPGEINIARLFSESLLSVLAEIFAPLTKISPAIVTTHLSSGVIERVDPSDAVIASEFSLKTAGEQQGFKVLWPLATVASLLPVFEGQKRGRDAAEDARWQRALRARITDAVVRISSDVGHTRMSLRAVANLGPGDVIGISNPQKSTITARSVPILTGRFGVHDGRYAIETTNWLESARGSRATGK